MEMIARIEMQRIADGVVVAIEEQRVANLMIARHEKQHKASLMEEAKKIKEQVEELIEKAERKSTNKIGKVCLDEMD